MQSASLVFLQCRHILCGNADLGSHGTIPLHTLSGSKVLTAGWHTISKVQLPFEQASHSLTKNWHSPTLWHFSASCQSRNAMCKDANKFFIALMIFSSSPSVKTALPVLVMLKIIKYNASVRLFMCESLTNARKWKTAPKLTRHERRNTHTQD